MADDEPATAEQIAEYESQLAGIVELLEASPGDESLLALKKDLEELLELSRANVAADTAAIETSTAGDVGEAGLQLPPPPLPPPPPPPLETHYGIADGASSDNAAISSSTGLHDEIGKQIMPTEHSVAPGESAAVSISKKDKPHKAKKSSKKLKKVKDFVLPDHLVPNDEDTDAQRNKKRKAAKALKSKWRLQKKEIESSNRQKSWQSFQKKSSSSSSGSIFATKEGVNDRVGVVSKKQLTQFGARKRHK